MIVGLCYNGPAEEAIRLLGRMEDTGEKPNGNTFLGVLSACSLLGLMDKGLGYYEAMDKEYEMEENMLESNVVCWV